VRFPSVGLEKILKIISKPYLAGVTTSAKSTNAPNLVQIGQQLA